MRQPPNRQRSENELECSHALVLQTHGRHQRGTKTFLAFDDARVYNLLVMEKQGAFQRSVTKTTSFRAATVDNRLPPLGGLVR